MRVKIAHIEDPNDIEGMKQALDDWLQGRQPVVRKTCKLSTCGKKHTNRGDCCSAEHYKLYIQECK